ncbi:UPF0276 protein [Trichinella pseudospiralis]
MIHRHGLVKGNRLKSHVMAEFVPFPTIRRQLGRICSDVVRCADVVKTVIQISKQKFKVPLLSDSIWKVKHNCGRMNVNKKYHSRNNFDRPKNCMTSSVDKLVKARSGRCARGRLVACIVAIIIIDALVSGHRNCVRPVSGLRLALAGFIKQPIIDTSLVEPNHG